MGWFNWLFNKQGPSKSAKSRLGGIQDNTEATEQTTTGRVTSSLPTGLSNKTRELALNQPLMWEYLLFFQSLIDEVDQFGSLRQARTLESVPGNSESIGPEQMLLWMRTRSDEATELVEQFGRLMNHDLQEAFGAPGESGDAAAIIIISREMGLIYKQFLEISAHCAKAQHDPVFDGIFREMSKINDDVIKAFEEFPASALRSLKSALAAPASDTKQTLNLTMVLSVNPAPLIAEIDKAESAFFSGR
ncbi:MAG: hypothetical protein JWL77_917 [Chthonomonadaceae bacterium]|nr:hypothetical protein [Chthonomonadaceae bacterium]